MKKRPDLKEAGDPYPTIAEQAMGKWMEIVVNGSVYFTLLGACIVLLILCSMNIRKLVIGLAHLDDDHVPICLMILIIGVVLIPFGWVKSPADMPYVILILLFFELFTSYIYAIE